MLLYPGGAPFAVGRAAFLDDRPGSEEGTAKIYVKIEPDALGDVVLAQVDTGAAWTILEREIAESVGLLDGEGPMVRLDTRFGPIDGRLERTPIRLLADEGVSLEVQATVFVSRDWPAGNFIGYNGLLERVRFAIDPRENLFHFGSADL